MYSLCKHAFAFIYGLMTIGGTSQPESSPVFCKELYSHPVDSSSIALKEITSVEYAEDGTLWAKRSKINDESEFGSSWWADTSLQCRSNVYTTADIPEAIYGIYKADLYVNETRFHGYGVDITFSPHVGKLPFTHVLMNRNKDRLLLATKEHFKIIDIRSKKHHIMHECKLDTTHAARNTLNAIQFVDNRCVVYTHGFFKNQHYYAAIVFFDLKINQLERYLVLGRTVKTLAANAQAMYSFQTVAATDDLVIAGRGCFIYLWERDTKRLLETLPVYKCSSIALHPKNTMCSMLCHKHFISAITNHEPHITTYALPQRSLYKKENMVTLLQRDKPNAYFSFI